MNVLLVSLNEHSAQNFGVLSIADALLSNGYNVRILGTEDGLYSVANSEVACDLLMARIEHFQPQVLGLSTFTIGAERLRIVLGLIKSRFPNIPLILGGYHTLVYGATILAEYPQLAYVFYGEGEVEFPKFLKELSRAKPNLEGIKGLIYRRDGVIQVNPPPDPVLLDNVNTYRAYRLCSDWDFMKQIERATSPSGQGNRKPMVRQHLYIPLCSPQVFLMLSRGCPYRCAFCHLVGSPYEKVRYVSPEGFAKMLEYVCQNQPGGFSLNLRDSALNLNRKWGEAIIKIIADTPQVVEWYCQLRPDLVTPSFVRKLRLARCRAIGLHVESGTNRIRNGVLNKSETTSQLRHAFAVARAEKMFVRGTIIIGTPKDREGDLVSGVRLLKSLGVDHTSPCPLILIPGTQLWNEYQHLIDDKVRRDSLENKYSLSSTESKLHAAKSLYVGSIEYERFQKWYWVFASHFSYFGKMLREKIRPDRDPLLILQGTEKKADNEVHLLIKLLYSLVNHVTSKGKNTLDVITMEGTALPFEMLPSRVRGFTCATLPVKVASPEPYWDAYRKAKYATLVVECDRSPDEILGNISRIGARLGVETVFAVDMNTWILYEYKLTNKLLSVHRFIEDVKGMDVAATMREIGAV